MTEQQNLLVSDATSDTTPIPPASLGHWYAQGFRSALLLPARWNRLQATPVIVAVLTVYGLLLGLLLERLYIAGPATFYWQAIASGWLSTVVAAWVCYLMRPQLESDQDGNTAPGAAHLFCVLVTQSQIIMLITGLISVALIRNDAYTAEKLGVAGVWAIWLLPAAWMVLAQITLLSRSGIRRSSRLLVAAGALIAATGLNYAIESARFWYAAEPAETDTQAKRKRLSLTQELMEAQPALLSQRLHEIKAQRPGTIDLFAITFAPYAGEDVFRRESDMVTNVITQRFDAQGRTMQLVNHVETLEQWPWATPKNLQRAIQHVAKLMNRDEDVLFIHLTSHGARDGELSAHFWPMSVTPVKPADLRKWLDDAGIRYRVISVSACYSGSWIDPLAEDNTLVMTASDAEHTSYGCGRHSELTYFGRAIYDEQLRNNTLSFQEAHAAAREVIRKREIEAGKDDGYSNPQIKTGTAIQVQLERLQQRVKQDR